MTVIDPKAIVEHSPALIWLSNAASIRIYVNPAWLAFTGRTLEQELGEGWMTGVHPEDLERLRVELERGFGARASFQLQYRLRRADGQYRTVLERVAPLFNPQGELSGLTGAATEVHGLRVADSSGEQDFFEMSLDLLCVAGFDGYMKRVNPSWSRTLGFTPEEMTSRPSIEFVHPEDRAATLAARHNLTTGRDMGPLVNRYLRKDGAIRWFEWRSVAHVERGLVYAAARDITEQKLAEERLTQAKELQEKLQRQLVFADRMASVGTLAAGVAHEINNPLAFVIANVSLLIEALDTLDSGSSAVTPAELREMANDVQAGAERIRKIVRGLKTFSRAEEERLAVIEVVPVLELAINMTYNELRHRARLVKDYGKVPLVQADDARLGQVFINLLINAAQATPEGDSASNEIRIVTSTDEYGRAVVEVRDTGAGIPPELIDRVFDPFFTTKPVGVGTGLGLSICHTIVTGLGGEISVSSVRGKGSTFRVVLPAAVASTSVTPPLAKPAPEPLACVSVLVIDDEPAIGVALMRALREHEVTAVVTAQSALELIRSGKHFDVIFTDLMMPEMSGMEFFEELTGYFPALAERVVFVTGGAFTPESADFLERTENERLEKPFSTQAVRQIVQRRARR